jgi:putative ABC transport system permease protein
VSTDGDHWMTIVGVIGDVRFGGLREAVGPAIYVPFAQDPFPGMYMYVRSAGDALARLPAVRRAVLAVDAELPLAQVEALDAHIAASVTDARFTTTLLALFAGVAFALASIGIYGVVSYGVARRRHEMGVRLALGARPSDVLRLVVGRALRPVAAGAVVGVGLAAFAARLLQELLFATSPHDPVLYGSVVALLGAVAVVASWLPATRATRVDPMSALRAE